MGRQLKERSREVLGVDQKIWVSLEEGGYGEKATSGLQPKDGGAIEHITGDVTFNQEREDSPSRSGRSVVARLSGKKTVEGKFEAHLIPANPDALGNPQLPPMHPFLATCFGKFDVTDPAKIEYLLSRFNGYGIRAIEEATHYSKLCEGLVMDGVTFTLSGDSRPVMSFEGFGQDAKSAGSTFLAQDITGTEVVATKTMQSLDFVAKVGTGKNGNRISLAIVDKDTMDGLVGVVVSGYDIVLKMDTGAPMDADAVILALTDVAVQALIDVPTVNAAANGTDVQALQVAEKLENGLGAYDVKVLHADRFDKGSLVDIVLELDGDTMINQARIVKETEDKDLQGILSLEEFLIEDNATAVPLNAAATGDFFVGHAPETYLPITSEEALLGLSGSYTLGDGSDVQDCELISAEIAMKNNYTKKDFLYGTDKNCGFIPDKRREVMVKLEVLLTKDNYSFYQKTKRFEAQNVEIVATPHDKDVKGRTFKFILPKVEFNIPPIENPADGYVTLALEGKALAPSMNQLDEEFKLVIE